MKGNITLLFSLVLCTSLFAQTNTGANSAQTAQPKNRTDVTTQSNILVAKPRGYINPAGFINIGNTYYDLQTNYAMPHRIYVDASGAISFTWTNSVNGNDGFPQRGSGYAHASSPSSFVIKNVADRVETVRTGWPSIGRLRNGNEFLIGHDATNGGFYITKNTGKGTSFGTSVKILDEAPYKPIWARMANSGDTIHMIYSYTDSSAAGEKRAPTRKGIFAPMVYSRSVDGGVNWDIKALMLPKYDSFLTNNGGADQYSIDCKGKTVAIVNADNLQGVVLWKSTDAGATFTRILADSFKYAPYKATKLMPDTPQTNDGTCDVLIDNGGKIHVFWGFQRVFDNNNTDQSYSFFPGSQAIIHWMEGANANVVADGTDINTDADGVNNVNQECFSSLSSGNLPTNLNHVARLGNTSVMRQPSAAIDANGNIYCTFSVPIEDMIDANTNTNFRDICVAVSKDGGKTWRNVQNITQLNNRECDFACVARTANGFLHVMWQQDDIPGTNLQNNSSAASNHPVVQNAIMYQAIPVNQILDSLIGLQFDAGVQKPNTGEVVLVNQNFPNPFSGVTNMLIYLTKPGNVNVEVFNSAGALVYNKLHTALSRGNHLLEVNAQNLKTGVYSYRITSGNTSVSNTMIVK